MRNDNNTEVRELGTRYGLVKVNGVWVRLDLGEEDSFPWGPILAAVAVLGIVSVLL